MSVELTRNDKRYMVDGGQWFRRLEVGEVIPSYCEVNDLDVWYSDYVPHSVGQVAVDDDSFRVKCCNPMEKECPVNERQ